MKRSEMLKNWIEEERMKYLEPGFEMSREEALKYVTEDFLVTNLQDNSVIGQGIEYAMQATEMEIEKKLVFKIRQMITAGDFEVCNYGVTNAKGETGGGTIIYRFRDNKICEMIVLDHD